MTTLLQIRDRCKQESDNVNFSFVTDAEWDAYIVASYQELYGLMATNYGNDYFTQTPAAGYTFTTTGTTQFFALPTDFFKLLGVDVQISAPDFWVTLKPFNMSERNRLGVTNTQIPAAGQTLRLLYIPLPTLPTVDASVVAGLYNGWEEYVIIDACIKAMAKEESDVSVLMARKSAITERLNSETESRDAGMPSTVSDVLGRQARAMRYRLNGTNLWLIGNGVAGWSGFGGDWDDGPGGAFW